MVLSWRVPRNRITEASVTSRLELIRSKALEMCQEIVTRSEQAYKDLDMWQGAQFLAEMSSIGKLIQIAHYCVEKPKRRYNMNSSWRKVTST
ncbi:unnamed protein product [Ranitomeya imitator]|uniref:Uncharacterized protein n=1 Tax=Ranitomeya imitator TaxID=111125 RepID=A0ABN9MH98_9NEOB|nr:unnamed protein product [Ranitomeya imitator]